MLYLQNKLEGLTLSMKDLYSYYSTIVVQLYTFKVSLQQVARLAFHNCLLLCISAVECCCAAVTQKMLSCRFTAAALMQHC